MMNGASFEFVVENVFTSLWVDAGGRNDLSLLTRLV